MPRYILDASALIAVLAQEKGMEAVTPHLPKSLISTVNLTEVATFMLDKGFTVTEAREQLKELVPKIIPYDENLAFAAAELRAKTRAYGLSLADRACLALAKQTKLPVLTADKAWKKLAVGVKIVLIR